MTKKLLWFSAICLLISNQTIAQVDVLRKAVEKINQYETISYSQAVRQKNPFSGDWVTINFNSAVRHIKGNTESGLFDIKDTRGYRYVYNGSIEMDMDLNEKTYQLKEKAEEQSYPTPYYWAQFIQRELITPPGKIKNLPDTLINKEACFHIKMAITDSASSKEIYDLCLNKTTYLPVYIKQYLQGKFGKGNMIGDDIAVMINEYSYVDYHTNDRNFTNIKAFNLPADFSPEKKIALIAVGNTAPDWELQSLKGNKVSNAQLKGTVTLIDFSFNACAACMLSIPTLKRLHDKYKGSNVKIMTVNTSDTKQSVIAFAKKNNINYLVLLNGSKVSKSFQVSAYPTFYVIDKEGTIAASFEGYSKELENELIEKIDKIR
jgi:peroxiredoxin